MFLKTLILVYVFQDNCPYCFYPHVHPLVLYIMLLLAVTQSSCFILVIIFFAFLLLFYFLSLS